MVINIYGEQVMEYHIQALLDLRKVLHLDIFMAMQQMEFFNLKMK